MILYWILIIILFCIILFFLIRTILVTISFFREVPYLPAKKYLYKEALNYLDIQDNEEVLDLGSGDGRVLVYASKKHPNTKFIGLEKDKALVLLSNLKRYILNRDNLSFICKDILEYDYTNTDKIYMYLTSKLSGEVLDILKRKAKVGCKVVAVGYDFGKSFMTANKVQLYDVKYSKIYVWEKRK